MHQALEVQEILAEIFSNLSSGRVHRSRGCDAQVLAGLARTCRSFKEPALDVLWRVLVTSSPLARCLPDASRYSPKKRVYSFWRRLTEAEWSVLQSYTRRIRSIERFNLGLDWVSVKTFLKPPITGPLFPNLRKLRFTYAKDMTLLWLPLPSLVELSATFSKSNTYPDFLKSLPETSPEIRTLSLKINGQDDVFNSLVSSCICRWQNLHYLACTEIALDTGALMHVFRMPALAGLDLDLGNVPIPSNSSLVFPNLNKMTVGFETPEGMLRLLRQAQFPAVTVFYAAVDDCRVEDLPPLLAGLLASHTTRTLQRLELETFSPDGSDDGDDLSSDVKFGFADLQPCTLFSDLRHLELNVGCRVDLTESHILTLASAWAKLEYLSINEKHGWRWHRDAGITPGGLIQLLRTCHSLTYVGLVVNTQGYTQVPPSHVLASLGLTFPSLDAIHVIDSAIEDESVAALTTFFSGIAACASTKFCFIFGLQNGGANDDYFDRWNDADYFDRWDRVDLGLRSSGPVSRVD